MNRVRVQAPGKAVLLGEYAVLEGAAALSMAVDRYARVVIEPCSSGECRISADSLGVAPLAFTQRPDGALQLDGDSPSWAALERTAVLLASLHAQALRRFGHSAPYRVDINTDDLYMNGKSGERAKLGLGSSSAVAVALDAGLRSYFGGRDVSGLSLRALKRLLEPYRSGQAGNASGIDLASSLCGGVIRYRIADGVREAEVSSRTLPEGLILLFVWTGKPASTPRMVEHYRAWRRDHPRHSLRLVEAMIAACDKAQRAIECSDADALVEQIACYGELMGTIGDQMGAAIVDEAHASIRARAEGIGLAYKPCGAGGGDLGMAAGTDPGLMHELEQWLEQNGFTPLVLTIDARGVDARLETSQTTC